MNRKTFGAGLLAACALSFSLPAAAIYPEKPVTLVIGFSAGGPTDIVGRYLAQGLSKKLGQTVVVENRPGATGVLALQSVKKEKPDGYTLMLGSSSTLSIEPVFKKNVKFDVFKELTPIAPVASYPYLLVVPASSPYTSISSLVQGAKQQPGSLSFASAGNGAVNHLAGEWFKSQTGIDITHIPYKGDSAAVSDLVAGRVDMAFLSIIAADPLITSGKMKALAIASNGPSQLKPGMPTVAAESGINDFSAEPWNGILGPANMPAEIVTTLNTAITEVMSTDQAKEKLATLGQSPFIGTADELAAHIRSEMKRWSGVIKKANIEQVE
ncbi:Bug family tripartite tricarboxylate transporter substrate binding protein [Advenella mimigardefordensis]|uniref:Putative Bug-like extracytoplasmic solute binding receptor, TTT family n=1 Tax=Advenella mimigardefordensis (strain DSM 17166 / LMG 22922 / DPN7) TaxID=1247726 RepID=W0PI88_ADVMD|nr:tripartite tricarboxylate transporter substrate binding protein [Advenella mimigardefordensis]AHG65165.1 putative Bug-like extracytoplasmic solute binding receptor, TTT family [Advenella mimigardefordensis DPN7]